jgi:transglutaminase-like putative cysteine protease
MIPLTRPRLLLRFAIPLIVALSPVLAAAQFQAPTDEELKMTSDPKSPGADAVYLYEEEIDNDPLHYQSIYERIKILTEKGKDLATVNLPYLRGNWKITDIKGRTIHSDGAIVNLDVKPEDLMTAKKGDLQINRKVFTLPSAEVGSIIEYRYEIRYDDDYFSSPQWDIQKQYSVRKAHYQFTPFKAFMPGNSSQNQTSMYLTDSRGRTVNSLIWWKRLPAGADIKTDAGGHYTVDVEDVPAAPNEDWMPPIRSYLDKVFFYYMAANSASDFWISEGKFGAKDADHFAEPTRNIHAAVEGIVAPSDSDLDKAKKLYTAVQALDNTDFSREKSESEREQLKIKDIKRAEDTLSQKSGSGDDIALLYLAMLRAAGLTAYPIKVVDRDEGIFDFSYMNLSQLGSTLVSVTIGGKSTLLDPGEKMCPFGLISWRHSEARGLGESSQGPSIVTTPGQNYTDNSTTRTASINVDERGGVTGSATIVITGQEALRWRQMALENDMAEVKKSFDRELEEAVPDGVEAHVDHFLAIDEPDNNLVVLVNLQGSIGTATAKRLLLPSFFFETRARVPFVNQEKREQEVDMHYGDRVTDQVTYVLPEDMTVEGAPADANISWAGHAVFIVKSKSDPGKLTVARSVARGFTLVKPEEYQDLRGFYQKVAAADQDQIVLTAASVGKGN